MSRSRLGLEAERLGSRLGLGHEGLVSIPATHALMVDFFKFAMKLRRPTKCIVQLTAFSATEPV